MMGIWTLPEDVPHYFIMSLPRYLLEASSVRRSVNIEGESPECT